MLLSVSIFSRTITLINNIYKNTLFSPKLNSVFLFN